MLVSIEEKERSVELFGPVALVEKLFSELQRITGAPPQQAQLQSTLDYAQEKLELSVEKVLYLKLDTGFLEVFSSVFRCFLKCFALK